MSGIAFDIAARDGRARTGTLRLPRGEIRTPAFMPVGTAGTVKAMLPESVRATGADILLGNTYHLMLRPGAERVARLGGLHRFMNWERPILTNSGGFQVMSLSDLRKLTEEGVTFRSHVDGSTHFLSPETQHGDPAAARLGHRHVLRRMPGAARDRGRRWRSRCACRCAGRQRSREAFGDRPGHALFGIQQGGVTRELREESAEALKAIGFDGYAIGGLAVGEGQAAMFGVLDHAPGMLPDDRPRYLMGVGKPDDIVGAVRARRRHVRLRAADALGTDRAGADPPRRGQRQERPPRRGPAAARPRLRLSRLPELQPRLPPPRLQGRRDHRAMLLTWHNLHYYQELMAGLRDAIGEGRLAAFVADFDAERAGGDLEPGGLTQSSRATSSPAQAPSWSMHAGSAAAAPATGWPRSERRGGCEGGHVGPQGVATRTRSVPGAGSGGEEKARGERRQHNTDHGQAPERTRYSK